MRCPILADLPSPPPNQTGWMWTEERPQLPSIMPDGHPFPRVTIVTPCYNQGRFIEATIRSVLLQGYPNLEYIIIDGGSSDKSVEIIHKYEPWLAYWASEEDRGQAHAINKGLARATGDIYAYLNSDDFYEPDALHACAEAYRNGRQWIVGRVRCWQEGVGFWPFPELGGTTFARWFLSCPIPQAGCFWSANLHRETGRFREDLNYIIDYEFWLRFRFIKKIKPFVIDRPIAVYRLHPQSKTVAHSAAFAPEIRQVMEQYKRLLTRRQQAWLWVASRHRKALLRVSKAVSHLKNGQPWAATRKLFAAFLIWPLIVIDPWSFLAFKELAGRNQDNPAFPEIWPD